MLKNSIQILKIMVLATGLLATTAYADPQSELLVKVSNILGKPAGLKVDFSQNKQIKGFKTPAKSSGHVLIAAQRGMQWVTDAPYQSTLKITPNGISEVRGGQTTQIGNAQSMKSMSAILSGMLSGDFKPMQRYFRFSGTAGGSAWSMKLTPVDANVKRAIASIQMSGGRYVNHVTVYEANGDVSNISFSGATPIAAGAVGL
jgi:hypothetical protein